MYSNTKHKRILYIDDEPFFIEPIIDALKSNGFRVDHVSTGSEAIEKLSKDSYTPDIIILDVIMPLGEKSLMLFRLRLKGWISQ